MTGAPLTEQPVRVLVVDDDLDQLDLITRLLTKRGFDVMTVDSPFGATNAARRFKPHVILIDVDMPAITGDKLVSLIRSNVALSDMSIVLFSSTDEDTLRTLAAKTGADGWIRKTFDPAVLTQELGRFTHNTGRGKANG